MLGTEENINSVAFLRETRYLLLCIKCIFEYLHEYQASNVEYNATLRRRGGAEA